MNRIPLKSALIAWYLLALPAYCADPKGIEFFESKIRPVLVEHCYQCHSAEALTKKKLRGGLLLDTREGILKGGDTGPALVPGKAKESLILKSLRHTDDLKMPPKGKLPVNIVVDFETWIAMGAPDPRSGAVVKQRGLSLEEGRKFWAYQLPKSDKQYLKTEIDSFIVSRLEKEGLKPSPEAAREVLVRRLYYDLIGIPPTPEEMERGRNDQQEDWYEKLVDQLIASPHFGERWGRHWLDMARYAESMTLRGFVFKEAWRYRDYVIDSFNDDVPFNQFIVEQIAGDLLPSTSIAQKRRQLIATSYLALGNSNLEEQDKKQLRMDVVDEQLDTIGRAFLAQTFGCARCHDHKFDPVPTKDYYAMAGILRNTKTMEHSNVSKWLEKPLPGNPDLQKELVKHEAALAAIQKEIDGLKKTVAKNEKPLNPAKPKVRAVAELPGIVVDDTQAKKVGEWKDSKFSGTYVGAGYIHDGDMGKGEKSLTFDPEIPANGKYEVWLAYSTGGNRCAAVPITVFSADGEKMLEVNQQKPPEIEGLFHSLGQYNFEKTGQSFVIVSNEGTKGHVLADAVLFIPVEKLGQAKETKAEKKSVVDKTPKSDAERLKQLEAEMKKLKESGPAREMTMSVEEEKLIEDTRVHVRGSVHVLGESASRGVLQVAVWGKAPTMPAKESGRRELAEWIASRDNPLTSRVLVNRVWHWLFGDGIVRTTDNFGTTGEKPSNPELLDHLAIRFMEDGWSIKKLVRSLVLSRTYRQSSEVSAKAKEVDPENRLLSHMNRRRLDAECIRDTILAVSGKLQLERGGPTFRANIGADYGYKHSDTRRSVYSPVFRNSLPELFEVFDFADPSVSTGKRNVSTVAPQALFMMNHPFAMEQARHAAKRLLSEEHRDDADRIARAYRLTLGRLPSEGERRLAEGFLKGAGAKPVEREEFWGQLFQVLFASVDFRYVN